jgi:hypothetical protein
MREQLDLDSLTAELLAVVDRTEEPAQVPLWLRPARKPILSSWPLQAIDSMVPGRVQGDGVRAGERLGGEVRG